MPDASDSGSLKRGVALLKLLATAGARGLALTELASQAGLPHPSAHRVLKQLIDEGLVSRVAELKRYRMGPLAFELGLASSTLYDIRDLCDPAMDELARATGDTVYLVVRSGFDAVCMHRREGSFPIRTLVLEVGSRRPLGVGAGGLAVLAAMDEAEREEVIRRLRPALAAFGRVNADAMHDDCLQTLERGHSLIQGTVNFDVTAVGRWFCNSTRQPVGALSVAALSQRMTPARTRKIAGLLKHACDDVEQRLRPLHSASRRY